MDLAYNQYLTEYYTQIGTVSFCIQVGSRNDLIFFIPSICSIGQRCQ